MRIGVIGMGVVGRAIARCYMEWADVLTYDCADGRGTHSFFEVAGCDLVFICIPEAEVDNVIERFTFDPPRCVVIKSTVPIGTTRRLREQYQLANLVHSPEFLTERCALVDAQTPARNIIGGRWCDCAALLHELYTKRFPGVPIYTMSSDESEAVKLITNAFFATKVSYFNEARALVDKLGMRWDAVREGVLSDGRIAHAHTQVPGPDGKFGVGGKCLQKDLWHYISANCDAGLKPQVAEAAYYRNLKDRERIH